MLDGSEKSLGLQDGQLFVMGGIVGHDHAMAAVVNHGFAADVFDDGGSTRCVCKGQVHIGLLPFRFDLHHRNAFQQGQRLGQRCGIFQHALRPQPGVQARFRRIARAEIRGVQVMRDQRSAIFRARQVKLL